MSFTFGGPSSPFKPKYMRGAQQPPAAPAQPGLPTLKPQEQYLQNQIQKTTQSYAPPLPTGTDPAPKQTVQYTPPPLPMGTEPAPNPQAAAAASAARASNVGAAAANRVGEQQQVAQGSAQANASTTAAAPAAVRPAPAQDFSLTKQPWITESGRLYERQVEDRMKGNDPLVTNAQRTADTQASRNNYYARTNAQEGAAQAKFAPGTIQYQRITDEAQAGANAANLTGQNNVNQFTRERSDDAMGLAKGLESTAYGYATGKRDFDVGQADKKYVREYQQGRDSVSDAQWNTTNTQNQTQQAWSNAQQERMFTATQEAVRKGDARAAIAAIGSTTGKNHLNAILASQGPDAVLAAIPAMFNNGKLVDAFADPNAVKQEAEDWISMTTNLRPGSPEFDAEVVKRMQELDAANRGPIDDATTARTLQEIKGMLDTGKPLDPTETEAAIKGGLIPPLAMNTIPAGATNVTRFIQQNPSGKFALNGQVYTLVKGSSPRTGRTEYTNSPRHTDVAELKDANGKTLYYYNGAIHNAYPKTVGDVDFTPFGF